MTNRIYVGRFAPSPTGPLHFGSLVAATGSYCDARAAGGRWLLRIEDIDPPREMAGASALILQQLEAYGFEWDDAVLFQHTRLQSYQEALQQLHQQHRLFWCRCSRRELTTALYPGHCYSYTDPRTDAAVRLRVPHREIHFLDRLCGEQRENIADTIGDFVIQRRDGLFAYQLAVVVDDHYQGITDIVRGADLLDNTARQILLQQQLGLPTPRYMHLPLVMSSEGQKLSKQNLAPALPLPAQPALLWQALLFLGQEPPTELKEASTTEILAWGIAHWSPLKISAPLSHSR